MRRREGGTDRKIERERERDENTPWI